MARGRLRGQWDQTATLWTVLANANRDPDAAPKPYHPADVHPLRGYEDYETDDDETEEEKKQRHEWRRLQCLPHATRRRALDKMNNG